MYIYLIGCMTHHDKNNEFLDKAVKWRHDIKERLYLDIKDKKHKLFDPTLNYNKNLSYNNKSIVMQNLHNLRKADMAIVNLDCLEFSPGSMAEIFLAGLEYNIPVIAFGESKSFNQPHIHTAITEKFDSLEEVCKYIKNLY